MEYMLKPTLLEQVVDLVVHMLVAVMEKVGRVKVEAAARDPVESALVAAAEKDLEA